MKFDKLSNRVIGCAIEVHLILFVLFVSFVVRTMGREKDANHKSMLHTEEPEEDEDREPMSEEEVGFLFILLKTVIDVLNLKTNE